MGQRFEGLKHFLFADNFSTVHGGVGVGESTACPAVHAQIKIAHAEDRCLESIGIVKRSPSELETFLNRSGDEDDVLCIAVTSFVEHGNVGLLGACW